MSGNLKLAMQQMIDEATMQKIVNVGEVYKLDDEERKCVSDHRMGTKTHLLRENYVVHRNGMIVTKLLTEDLNIEEFIRDLLHAIGFSARVFVGEALS